MQLIYQLLAELTFSVHLIFIIFAIFGGLACLRWKWLLVLHLPCLTWAILIWFFRWRCPLTPLENQFRAAAGLTTYDGGFISHYIYPLIYISPPTTEQRIILGSLLIIGNLIAYGLIYQIHFRPDQPKA